ncbi:CsbD family protein [Longivirga aurantiaca]|uniref:CsbD family protein n=1 Tax=Longivirga aurantiaca TaxID=1837743 RepID=A0ABW1T2D4_9ACTN
MTMSTEDKAKNLAQKTGGAIKEAAGKVTGNESLEAEGKVDQSKADLKQGAEKLKDGVRDATS